MMNKSYSFLTGALLVRKENRLQHEIRYRGGKSKRRT